MKIYIVRHGETDWNNQLIIQGCIDNPLNSTGIQQAHDACKLVAQVSPTKIISSSLSRARQTAEIFATENNWSLPIETNDNFIERNFGDAEGEHVDYFYSVTDHNQIPNIETDHALKARVEHGITELIKSASDTDIFFIFAHSHVLKTVMNILDPHNIFRNTKIPNCAILELETDPNLHLIDIKSLKNSEAHI